MLRSLVKPLTSKQLVAYSTLNINNVDNIHELFHLIKTNDLESFSSRIRTDNLSNETITTLKKYCQSNIALEHENNLAKLRSIGLATCVTLLSAKTFHYSMSNLLSLDVETNAELLTNYLFYGSPAMIAGGFLLVLPWIIVDNGFTIIKNYQQVKIKKLFIDELNDIEKKSER